MKIRYAEFDKALENLETLQPTDSVNVFINLESVLKSISTIKDVDRKVYTAKDFNELIISNIVNLAAHYRKFFRGNGLDTRVYLYMTDFMSTRFNENIYNEDYRSYYTIKYAKNPKYSYMGEKLNNEIFPYLKEIIACIPGVYFINTMDVDGAVVPLLISQLEPQRKNIVITGEYTDTQYSLYPNFSCHYLRRSPTGSSISHELLGHLMSLLKKPTDKDYDLEVNMYHNLSFYTLLFAVIGDQYRSIDGINNVGNMTLLKYLEQGMKDSKITMSTFNISMIKEIFPEEVREEVEKNFRCLQYMEMRNNLTKEQEFMITSQLVNKFDNNSLLRLNSTKFYNHRFMLEELTM